MDEQQQVDLPHSAPDNTVAFPIVGIGASAGGLPAVMHLLENMPAKPGMALVVVLHLAPDAPSASDRLLQRVSELPVVQVQDRVRLVPDQVYVIAPGRSLRMVAGELVADEQRRSPGMPMTVDTFFRTLAEAHGEQAVGVVLSGMGSDGAAGLACIREHGGVTIAQLPDDADESGMPQAAIDSGMVDFVLRATEVPARLMELRDAMRRIAQHGLPAGRPFAEIDKDSGKTLDGILALLRARTGHDCRDYKRALLLRRLARRLQIRGAPDLPAYFALLQEDEQEPVALLQELLIGVTNFFRDREAFDVLETILFRLLHEKVPGTPLRAWVSACATGEEAYSVAMLLAEHCETEGPSAMQVFATDLDERAIAVARAGRYPEAIAADVPPERLARFFVREDDGFRIRKLLRDRILFARHDMVHDPAFSNLDLITCRNVLIYLNRDVQRRVFEIFHCALRPGGYLFLGSAESADLASDLFTAVSTRHRLYQAKPAAKTAHCLSMTPAHAQAGRQAGAVPARAESRPPTFAELHQRTLLRLAPPSVLVDARGDVVHASDGIAAFLRHGGGEPSNQVLSLVLPALRGELRGAMFEATESGRPVRTAPLPYQQDGEVRAVSLSVTPVDDDAADKGMLLIRFEAAQAPSPGADGHPDTGGLPPHGPAQGVPQANGYAASSNARLEAANEMLHSTVEELRASVEELEVDREDLQSRNEELQTINAELKIRIDETAKAHDDLSNLIASSDIATLFLDRRLRIQRYTPQVTRIFNLIPADVGRPLAHLTNRLETKQLLDDVTEVFTTLQPIERELRSTDGRHYIVRVHPYRTAYDRIEGAVLTFFDITSRRAAEKALRESEQRLALAFAALPVGICTIDRDGNTVMLNEVMRRFLPAGATPSRDPAHAAGWAGWYADGTPVQPRDFPGARALRGESALSGMQMLYRADDGSETWTEVRSAPLRDSEGRISGALVVVIDVDQLKRSEETARESARHHAILLALSDALRGEQDPDATAARAIRMVLDALQLDRCGIVSSDPAEDRAEARQQAGNERVPPLPVTGQLSAYPQALGVTLGRPLVVEGELERQEAPAAQARAGTGLAPCALVASTLRRADHGPAWTMVAISASPRRWTPGEIGLVEAVAERTWTAIERARAERRAESILEHMGDAHCVLDREYHILGVNAAAERLLGRPRDTLLGRSHWEAFPASVDAPVGRAFRRVVEDGVEQHFAHHYTGEGYDIYLEVDAFPTEEGGVAMFWRDVTVRVHAEQALRASEEKYRSLFNEMDEAYAVVEVMADAAGRWTDFLFLEVNPAFMRHTGMPYPVGRTATQLLGTPNPRWAELYGQAAQTGEPIRLEESEMMLGRVFDLNIFRLGDEGSRRVAVLFTDITVRKQVEAALRESEARFRALAEASPALIWQIDETGRLSYVNGRCLDVTGASLDELRTQGWHGVLHPDDAPGYVDAVTRTLHKQDAFQQRVRLRRRDGGYHWFESHALPWVTAHGQFGGLVGISLDIDETVRAEEALKTADRRKDEFLATLAHELRNPLAPISNALQFLRHPGGKRRADRLLAMVERQVRQMVRLVDDLMEVTRICRGKVDLRRAPVALLEVLNSAVETSLPAIEQKRQQLTVDASDETLKLDADKVRLTQVFANLLNNAAKYTPPGGRVWLTARRDGQSAMVAVRDTGMGIPPEQLPMIFEMFSQPHGRNGHSESGLGIGLAMVRSLVDLHGGSVQAHSDGPGQGSEFTVRLPLSDDLDAVPPGAGTGTGAQEAPAALAGQRILVVDDNRDAADTLCQLLAARGAEARAVYGGRAAIEALDGAAPDAIVLDIGMPDMDGYEVARQIRGDQRAEGIQLVALSGWGQQADRQRSQACGFNHHLTKPAELDSLLEILSTRRDRAAGPRGPV